MFEVWCVYFWFEVEVKYLGLREFSAYFFLKIALTIKILINACGLKIVFF